MLRDQNYEGKSPTTQFTVNSTASSLTRSSYTLQQVPERFHILNMLSEDARRRLEAQCSAAFLSCIDFDMTATEDAIMAYDVLYNLFCKKFQGVTLEDEVANKQEG